MCVGKKTLDVSDNTFQFRDTLSGHKPTFDLAGARAGWLQSERSAPAPDFLGAAPERKYLYNGSIFKENPALTCPGNNSSEFPRSGPAEKNSKFLNPVLGLH